jgi:hypothetical protein
MMSTKASPSRGSLFGNVLTGHTVNFATHTSTICIKYQVLLAAYYKAVNANKIYSFYMFSLSVFRYLLYSILRYFFLFLFIVFSALGDCLVVKLDMCVTVLKSFTALSVFGLCTLLECTGEHNATTRCAPIMRVCCGANLNCLFQLWAIFSHPCATYRQLKFCVQSLVDELCKRTEFHVRFQCDKPDHSLVSISGFLNVWKLTVQTFCAQFMFNRSHKNTTCIVCISMIFIIYCPEDNCFVLFIYSEISGSCGSEYENDSSGMLQSGRY